MVVLVVVLVVVLLLYEHMAPTRAYPLRRTGRCQSRPGYGPADGQKRKKIENKEEKKQAAKILSGIGVDSPGGGTSESTSESVPHPLKIWAAKSIHAFGRGWAGRHKKALEQVPSAERGD